MAALFFTGRVTPPWEELPVPPPPEDGEEAVPAPARLVAPEIKRFWAQACGLDMAEQVYLLVSRTQLRHEEVLDFSTQERVRWVSRVLQDQEVESRRYNNLVDVMIRLWSS